MIYIRVSTNNDRHPVTKTFTPLHPSGFGGTQVRGFTPGRSRRIFKGK